jgi:hypothetical protein
MQRVLPPWRTTLTEFGIGVFRWKSLLHMIEDGSLIGPTVRLLGQKGEYLSEPRDIAFVD